MFFLFNSLVHRSVCSIYSTEAPYVSNIKDLAFTVPLYDPTMFPKEAKMFTGQVWFY